mmetsp:Transcript_20367/g.56749  ORF Transcript_20367/g.56749 Transcript_20367/m.56749 type:complete len:279 (-) Transcript_20367:801-1637(-)
MAHIARRGTDEPADAVLLHILSHVNADHHLLVVKQQRRQGLGQLRFTHTSGPQEQEGCTTVARSQARAATQHSVRHCINSLILAHHTLVQLTRQVQQLLTLCLLQAHHRDARPSGHHSGNFLRTHSLCEHGVGLGCSIPQHLEPVIHLWQGTILEVSNPGKVTSLLCQADVHQHLLTLGLQPSDLIQTCALAVVLHHQRCQMLLQGSQLFLDLLQAPNTDLVLLLLQGCLLHLQPCPHTLHTINDFRLGVQLNTHVRTCLIHQVDGLVRQVAGGDVAV